MAHIDRLKARLKRSIKYEVLGKHLTPKELEVLKWCCSGKTSWEIALISDVSEATIKYHLKNIYAKLGVCNRAHAVAEAHYQGILESPPTSVP
jgi:DNA-binding CsgD family transcriptional regulator